MNSGTLVEIMRAAPAPIIAVAVLVIAVRGFRRLEAKVGGVTVQVDQVATTTDAVNRAVNNVRPDEPTLRTLVVDMKRELCAHVDSTNERLVRIEEHLTNPNKGVTNA